jgi:hypothetical protein
MSAEQNEIKSAIRLPSVLAIGFTGHRSLPDEAASRKLVCDFLRDQKAAIAGIVYGVSSAAAGGDLLFAESCVQLEIPLRVLLPLPQERFRDDFDTVTWLRVEQVLSKAVSVEVTGDRGLRDEDYYQCGIETVQQSQLMVALWDGEPARGMGGTQEIVSFARKMGRPVVWFHSVTGFKQVFNEPALRELEKLQDRELDFLNGLPDDGGTLLTDSSTELATAWLEKVDKSASRFAPQVRRLSSIPIVCTAAAAFFSGAGLKMPHPDTWLAIGTGLGITAAALPFALRLQPRQVLWARARTAAEVCRSRLALWGAPTFEEAIGPEIVPELSGMLMSLKLLKAFDSSRSSVSIDEFKERYRKERVSGQLGYFSRHAEQSADQARRYRVVSWVCIGLAILIAGWLWVMGMAFKNTHLFPGQRWLSIAVSALFQLATISGALLIVHDCERRQRRYRELHDWLKEWDAELDALRTWPTVLKVAGRIERALLVELLEWKSLVRNVKLPRN